MCVIRENCFAETVLQMDRKGGRSRITFLTSEVSSGSGRGAFPSAIKSDPRGPVERWEVRMQAQVAPMLVRVQHAENPRFPGQRESSLGESILRSALPQCGGSRWKSRLIFLHLVLFAVVCA